MSVMPPKLYHGCGRGVFGLKEWNKPLRRPRVLIGENRPEQNIKSPDALKSPEIKCGSGYFYLIIIFIFIFIFYIQTIENHPRAIMVVIIL
jgi:hypothetical protein